MKPSTMFYSPLPWRRVKCAFGAFVLCAQLAGSLMLSRPATASALKQQPNRIQQLFASNRVEAIRLLAQDRSVAAKQVLLETALGQHGDEGRVYAATMFVDSLEDRRRAADLLQVARQDTVNSPADKWIESQVLDIALNALLGCSIDQELWQKIEPLFQREGSDGWTVRWKCAKVLRVDPSAQLGKAKVQALLASLDSAWRRLDPAAIFPMGNDGWLTGRSALFEQCLSALAEARSVTLNLLQNWDQPLSEVQRKCLTLARALRGDAAAETEYRRFMEQDPDCQLRWVATRQFVAIARLEDMPLLERIAQTDPCVVAVPEQILKRPGMEWAIAQGGKVYPVRQAAAKVIGYLRPVNKGKGIP